MSDGGLTVLDGTHLRAVNLALPSPVGSSVTGAQLLEFAESKVSESLFGFSLPDALKSAALKRIGVSDDLVFRGEQLDRENASSVLRNFVDAIANELQGKENAPSYSYLVAWDQLMLQCCASCLPV